MPFDEWDGELYHYGVPGMKWGIRRYQNKDGSLTALAKKRYGSGSSKNVGPKTIQRDYNALTRQYIKNETKYGLLEKKSDKFISKLAKKTAKRAKKGVAPSSDPMGDTLVSDKRMHKKYQKVNNTFKNLFLEGTRIDSMQNLILKKAERSGYSVQSKEVKRLSQKGMNNASKILKGPLGKKVLDRIVTRENVIRETDGLRKIKVTKKK